MCTAQPATNLGTLTTSTAWPPPSRTNICERRHRMTQPELADLIERGYENDQVREEHTYFFFQTGSSRQTEDGSPIFLCNALGAAFVALYGLEKAWEMWSNFNGSCTELLRDLAKWPWPLISQISFDHNSNSGSLAQVLKKLRASQYKEGQDKEEG